MHSAPTVRHPVGRSRAEGAIAAVVVLAGCFVCAYLALEFASRPRPPGWPVFAMLVACPALAAGLASASWARAPEGELRWDGEQWYWGASGQVEHAGEPRIALDLGASLLVSFDMRPETLAPGRWGIRSRWLWLERRRAPYTWGLLRAAVYSRARQEPALRVDAAPARNATP